MNTQIKTKALKKIIEICILKKEDKKLLNENINNIICKENTIYNLLEFTAEKNIQFLLNIDNGAGFCPIEKWIEIETTAILKEQFEYLNIKLPKFKDYGTNKFINIEMLREYNKRLKEHNIQMSHIENKEYYENLFLIHKITDKNELSKVFKEMECELEEIK